MKIQLIKGHFESQEAIDILTQMIQVKIKFHEDQIHHSHNEEDIKMREKRIKQLQHDLSDIRNHIQQQPEKISLQCEVQL
jgi:hypothetical protein